jgi:hypothetical protein
MHGIVRKLECARVGHLEFKIYRGYKTLLSLILNTLLQSACWCIAGAVAIWSFCCHIGQFVIISRLTKSFPWREWEDSWLFLMYQGCLSKRSWYDRRTVVSLIWARAVPTSPRIVSCVVEICQLYWTTKFGSAVQKLTTLHTTHGYEVGCQGAQTRGRLRNKAPRV